MIPEQWRFCRVGANKAPYERGWESNPLTLDQVEDSPAVGVLCGPLSGGLVMVDHDGDSCDPIVETLSNGEGLPATVTVTSGRPGRFQSAYWVPKVYWERCKGKKYITDVTDDQGKPEQLDIRWSGRQSVIQGVHPDTGSYKWVNSPDDTEVAQAPGWIIDILVNAKTPLTKVKPELDDFENLITIEAARNFLLEIEPAEDYDLWIKVGMALKDTSPDLFDDWVAWSEKANNHCSDPEEYKTKWDTFNREGLTAGTLYYLAYGEEDKPLEKIAVERKNDIKRWAHVATEERFYYIANPRMSLGKIGFNSFIGPIPVEDEKGKIKYEPASKHILRKNQLAKLTWRPGEDRILKDDDGFSAINLHIPYRMGNMGDPTPMVDHIEYLYPEEANVIFDWMAITLQKPWVKVNFALYIVGKEGTGKNTMFEPMKWAMKSEYLLINASDLDRGYNGQLVGTKALIIDEPRNTNDSRWSMAESLKSLLATSSDDEMILLKPKYGKELLHRNLFNTAILTNHADSIRITGARRFYPCYDDKPAREGDYYTRLRNWMDNGGNEAFVRWLFNRDISNFSPKVLPVSTSSRDAIELESRTSLSDALEEAIDEIGVTTYAICKEIALQHVKYISDAGLKRAINELDCVVAPRTVNGKKKIRKVTIAGNRKQVVPVYKKDLEDEEAFQILRKYFNGAGNFPGLGFSDLGETDEI
jgi:hypothetical protein